MTKTSGIYKLSIENKFYIGSSVNLETRFTNHKSKLKTKHHENVNIQAAYKECQELKFEILELCNEEDLLLKEQFYIDQFFGMPDCMNMTSSKECFRMSPEERAKMSIKLKGNTNGKGGKGIKRTPPASATLAAIEINNIPVIVINKEGIIFEYNSIKNAAIALNVPYNSFYNWVKGLRKPTKHKEYIGWLFHLKLN